MPDEEDQEEEIQEMGRSKRKRVQTSRGSDSFILSSNSLVDAHRRHTRKKIREGIEGSRNRFLYSHPTKRTVHTNTTVAVDDGDDDDDFGRYRPKPKAKGKFKPSKTQKKKAGRRNQPI